MVAYGAAYFVGVAKVQKTSDHLDEETVAVITNWDALLEKDWLYSTNGSAVGC